MKVNIKWNYIGVKLTSNCRRRCDNLQAQARGGVEWICLAHCNCYSPASTFYHCQPSWGVSIQRLHLQRSYTLASSLVPSCLVTACLPMLPALQWRCDVLCCVALRCTNRMWSSKIIIIDWQIPNNTTCWYLLIESPSLVLGAVHSEYSVGISIARAGRCIVVVIVYSSRACQYRIAVP